MKHYIYKYVNKNSEIIYIGKSDAKVTNRLNQHGKHGDNLPSEAWDEINNSKIYRFECVDSVMSDYYESEMIRRHKPKWNRSKTKDWKGFPFLQEPEWELYLKEEKKKTDTPFKNYLLPPFNPEKLSSIKNLFVELYNRKEQISLQYLWLESNIKKFVNATIKM